MAERRSLLCVLFAVLVTQQRVSAGGMLQPHGDVVVCPGAVTVYTCELISENGEVPMFLTLDVGEKDGNSRQRPTYTSMSHTVGDQLTLFPGIRTNLTEESATRLAATLTINATALDIAPPITLECLGGAETIGMSEWNFAELPGKPDHFEIVSQSSLGSTSTLVVLSWSPSTFNRGGPVEEYFVTLTPSVPASSPFTILTSNTTVAVSLPSHKTYDMSVQARNCVGTSNSSAELNNINVPSSTAGDITCVPVANTEVSMHSGTLQVMLFQCVESNCSAAEEVLLCSGFSTTTTDTSSGTTSVAATSTESNIDDANPTAEVVVVLNSAVIAGIACGIAAVFVLVVMVIILLVVMVMHYKRGASKKVTINRGASNAMATGAQDPQSPSNIEEMYSTLQSSYKKENTIQRNGYQMKEFESSARNGTKREMRENSYTSSQQQFSPPTPSIATFYHILDGSSENKQPPPQHPPPQHPPPQHPPPQQPPHYHVLESSTPIHSENIEEGLLYDEVRTFDKPILSKSTPSSNHQLSKQYKHGTDNRTAAVDPHRDLPTLIYQNSQGGDPPPPQIL